MIPFDEIRRLKDRSWSIPLVEMIERGEIENANEICHAIGALEDPRVIPRLRRVLEDVERSLAVREVAAEALNETANVDTAEQRQKWWQSGDFLLMRHAVRMAERTEKDLLLGILADASSPFYVDALNVIQWWEEPRYQQILMGALRHEDAAVRETAADCLVWEQPNDAAAELLRLAADARYENVAIGAMNTLNYYATQEVLLRFHALLLDGPAELRENYQAGADYVRDDFITSCRWAMSRNMAVRDYLLAWLQPVMHLFKAEDFRATESVVSPSRPRASRPELVITADDMIADLSDIDGCWEEKYSKYLGRYDWAWLTNEEAIRLVRFLSEHDDLNVRELAASIAGHRKLSDPLFDLLHDPTNRVKKSAAYNSRMLAKEPRFEQRLWQLLINPETQGFFATETLESYILHSDDQLLDARLEKLALEDERPAVKAAAVSALQKRSARAEIHSVSCLLEAPAFNNWWVHRNVLDACAELRLPTSIDHMLTVDDVHLQVALAEYKAGFAE